MSANAGKANADAEDFLESSLGSLASLLRLEPRRRQAFAVEAALSRWRESLPQLGACLAPELDAGDDALTRAFSRGKLGIYNKGDRLQGEGEEVRYYSIVLAGSCKTRCRAPAPKTVAFSKTSKAADLSSTIVDEEEDAFLSSLDEDGCVHVGVVHRGEPIGLLPGEPRAPWEVVAVERVAILQLSAEDYSSSLKPFQRKFQAGIVEFLRQQGVCPQGTASSLMRLTSQARQRTFRKGAVLHAAGENQRHVFILKSGTVSVLSPPQEKDPVEADADEDEWEEAAAESERKELEVEEEVQRRERLRSYSMQGSANQLKGAANEARNQILKKHARGALNKALRGDRFTKPQANLGVTARKDGLVPTATVTEPGSIVGEEVLLYDTFRELAVARNCYTTIAEEDCICLVVDLAAFQVLRATVGADTILERTRGRINRHASQHTHCRRLALQMTKESRQTKRREHQKQERQALRLPPSYSGASPLDFLESTDDWLGTVLQYKKAPKNPKMPGSLMCLTTLALDPLTFQAGPGTAALLQSVNGPLEFRTLREGRRHRSLGGLRLDGSRNPMGEFIQKEARYLDTPAPPLPSEAPPPAVLPAPILDTASTAGAEGDYAGGGFFYTEIEESTDFATKLQSEDVSFSMSMGDAFKVAPEAPSRSSSVPVLPRLASDTSMSAASFTEAMASGNRNSKSPSGPAAPAPAPPSKRIGNSREARITRTFCKTIAGKSVLVLTDQADSRKSLMRGLQAVLTEFELVFAKSTTELWSRLNASKETHHTLILDLAKNDLQADALLKTVRSHHRYARLPILVLSSDRELSATVRSSCSFVVFQPISAPMLREGLLWCLDKKAVLGKTAKAEAITSPSLDSLSQLGSASMNTTEAFLQLHAHAAPMAIV